MLSQVVGQAVVNHITIAVEQYINNYEKDKNMHNALIDTLINYLNNKKLQLNPPIEEESVTEE